MILKNDELMKKKLSAYNETVVDAPYIYCTDDEYQYIVESESCEVIYKRKYTPYGKSCFSYCGETENGPAFYDVRYSTYIYPTKDGYKISEEIITEPITANGYSFGAVTEAENGIGVIDACGREIFENLYDAVTLEIKIVASKDGKVEEKIIPFFKNKFKKGDESV